MTLRWKFRDTRDSEFATAWFGGLKVTVEDCDGDSSRWWIVDPNNKNAMSGKPFELASGECHTANYKTDPYHMLLAQEVAERCVRSIAGSRRAAEQKAEQSA